MFDELGIYCVLAEAEQPASVERFVWQWLGALIDYDEQTNSALVVHRSTLRFRLQRIREISGHDLADPETCFNLQVATRAWQTLLALRATRS